MGAAKLLEGRHVLITGASRCVRSTSVLLLGSKSTRYGRHTALMRLPNTELECVAGALYSGIGKEIALSYAAEGMNQIFVCLAESE